MCCRPLNSCDAFLVQNPRDQPFPIPEFTTGNIEFGKGDGLVIRCAASEGADTTIVAGWVNEIGPIRGDLGVLNTFCGAGDGSLLAVQAGALLNTLSHRGLITRPMIGKLCALFLVLASQLTVTNIATI